MKKIGTIYEDRENCIIAKVYDYTLDTAKEFESKGWKLTGTFYNFLTFVKNK